MLLLPEDPARTLQEAQLAALRSLVDILHDKTNKGTRHIYYRAKSRLEEAIAQWERSIRQGTPDFSCVTDKENTFRTDELENTWETTLASGNLETKRVKSERDGTVGPVNKMLSIFGALLRDHFLFSLPLEQPVEIGKKKTRTVCGYRSAEVGDVPVAHGADLPELDLADMIRSHGRELVRKSFIDSAEYKEFRRYAYLLIRRLTPFVEYIYTDGKHGRRTFHRPKNEKDRLASDGPCGDDILGELTKEIASLFGRKRGRAPRPSRSVARRKSKLIKSFFKDQINELVSDVEDLSQGEIEHRAKWAADLQELTEGKKPRLRLQDATSIRAQASVIARWEGTHCHKVITEGFAQPFNLTDLISGRVTVQWLSSRFAVATEVPIETERGRGKADIVLLQHLEGEKKANLLRPVAVFEVKTRTGMNWEIVPKKLKSKRKDKTTGQRLNRIVSDPQLRKRWLNDREWERELGCIPTPTGHSQLRMYEQGILKEYQRLTGDTSVEGLLRGVILVDSQKDYGQTRQLLYSLLASLATEKLEELIKGKPDRVIARSKDTRASRICMVLDSPKEHELKAIHDFSQTGVGSEYSPFQYSAARKGEFILYLSLPSASRSGRTAARIAQYWHGLQLMKRICEQKHLRKVVWIDLSGDFAYRPLAEVKLRIERQSEELRQFFSDIEFIDLTSDVDGFLFRGKKPPIISSKDEILGQKDSLVVVSGWEPIERSCPSRLRASLHELERVLVEDLGDSEAHVLWFGRAPTYEQTSLTYHKRCHLPFDDSSPLGRHVTRIIWNLPVKPYAMTHMTPMLDDVRVVVDQRESFESKVVEVPVLKDWSSRFWSRRSKRQGREKSQARNGGRQSLTAHDVISSEQISRELQQDALDLIPWIRSAPKGENEFLVSKMELLDLELQYIPVYGKPSLPSGVLSRMTYRPRPRGATGTKSTAQPEAKLAGLITHPKQYRGRELKSKPIKESHRSPMEELLVYNGLREDYADKTEVRRCRRVLRVLDSLGEECFQDPDWKHMLSGLREVTTKDHRGSVGSTVREIARLLSQSKVSKQLWDEVAWIRERTLGEGLQFKAREALETIMESRPQVSSLYGNYLFLLLAALSLKYQSLGDPQLEVLWSAVKSWTLVQLGFIESTHEEVYGRPKFHARAIWTNLAKRARILSQIAEPHQAGVRSGRLIMGSEADEPYAGLFLEDTHDRTQVLCGFWNTLTPLRAGPQFSWTLSDHREIVDAARALRQADEHLDIVIATMDGEDYLWEKEEDQWLPAGKVSIVHRKRDASARIRGIRIEPDPKMMEIDPPRGVTLPYGLEQHISRTLSAISEQSEHLFSVTCDLEVQKRRYVVEFSAEGETIDIQRFESTSELIALLRSPLTEGVPLDSSRDAAVRMTWDPYKDIIYNELQLLRPYVERRTPYVNVEVPLPFSCADLLKRREREIEVTVRHDEAACPIVDSGMSEHGLCWRVALGSKCRDPDLKALETSLFSDYDISSMLIGRELFFERGRYRLDIEFDEDPTSREGRVFKESKRIARALGEKPVPPGSFQFLDSEQLVFTLTRGRGSVGIVARSDITGEVVSRGTLIRPKGKWDVQEELQGFTERTETFIRSYFGEDAAPEKRVYDYNEMLDEMRECLHDLKKKR